MQKINYSDWPRREVYEFFSTLSHPFYMVTFRQDVTALYDYAKAKGLSFYYSMVWACTKALNDVEAFLICAREGELYRLSRRDPSFTDLRPGDEQFHIVTLPMDDDLVAFCRIAGEKSRAQQGFICAETETDELIYFSCLPWLDITALTNERDMSSTESLNDNIPRLTWGKYTEENGRKTLGLSLEVNHRFIDGAHIGRFAERLTYYMEHPEG